MDFIKMPRGITREQKFAENKVLLFNKKRRCDHEIIKQVKYY